MVGGGAVQGGEAAENVSLRRSTGDVVWEADGGAKWQGSALSSARNLTNYEACHLDRYQRQMLDDVCS
jgi:hypothetical protein